MLAQAQDFVCTFVYIAIMTSVLSAAADPFFPSGVLTGNASKQMHLASPSEEEARGVRLVASASGVLDRLAVSFDAHDSHMALKNEEGELVSGHINTICRYLATVGDRGEQLLGSTPETQAQVGFQSCSRRLRQCSGLLLLQNRLLYQVLLALHILLFISCRTTCRSLHFTK